jgi:hypothetical protein
MKSYEFIWRGLNRKDSMLTFGDDTGSRLIGIAEGSLTVGLVD